MKVIKIGDTCINARSIRSVCRQFTPVDGEEIDGVVIYFLDGESIILDIPYDSVVTAMEDA